MKEITIRPTTFATKVGLILMAVPSFFWLGIVLAVCFEKPVIVHEVMLPIDQVSSLFTLMIMVGLPLITFLVNLKSLMLVEFNPYGESMFLDISYKNNKATWWLMAYAIVSIVITTTYAFFENFNFYSAILS